MEIQEYLKYRVDLLNESKDEDGFINETNNYGSQIKNVNDFDRIIRRLIDSRMTTGEARLSDLLELCRNTYFNLFKTDIPKEKLSELKEDIVLNPISSRNGENIIFRKLH